MENKFPDQFERDPLAKSSELSFQNPDFEGTSSHVEQVVGSPIDSLGVESNPAPAILPAFLESNKGETLPNSNISPSHPSSAIESDKHVYQVLDRLVETTGSGAAAQFTQLAQALVNHSETLT